MDLANTLSDMLTLHPPVIEKVVRPVVVYLFLIAAFRLAGKRELLQFTTFDFVLLLLLSNAVQNAIIGEDDSLTGGLIGGAALLGTNAVLARVLYASPRANRAVIGQPDTIIEDGVPQLLTLKRLRISHDDLVTLVHQNNFTGIRQVQHAEVQPTGTVIMRGYHPSADERRMAELLERLARIEVALGTAPPAPDASGSAHPGTTAPDPGRPSARSSDV